MITVKTNVDTPGEFEVFLNRKATGLFVKGDSAVEVENGILYWIEFGPGAKTSLLEQANTIMTLKEEIRQMKVAREQTIIETTKKRGWFPGRKG